MKQLIIIYLLALLFSSLNLFSQENKINQEILDQSCRCIKKISYDLTKIQKNDSVKSCITGSIIANQTKIFIAEMAPLVDSVKNNKTDTISNLNFKIIVDKDYNEIEKRLLQDCSALKNLLTTNNETNKNSMSSKKKALDFFEEGHFYLNQAKYDLALVAYNNAVKIDSKFAFAWDNMGICYRKLNRYKEAIDCYKKSLEIDPEGTVPLMNMAVAYNLLNLNKDAIETYEKYIKLHPEDPEGYYGISRLQNITGDYENALENAFKAYQLYDKNGSPYKQDAINVLKEIVVNIKNDGKVDMFNTFADKYGLKKIE